MPEFQTLHLMTEVLEDLTVLSRDDQRRVLRVLARLDADEKMSSLRVHELQGKLAGQWSASVSKSPRITSERLEKGQKRILGCSHHYGD